MSIRSLISAVVACSRAGNDRHGWSADPVRLIVAFLTASVAVAVTSAPPSAYDIYKFDVRGLRLGDNPKQVIALLSKSGAVHVDRVYCEVSRIKAIKHRRDPSGVSRPDADCISGAYVRVSKSADISVSFAEDLTKRNRPSVATKIQYTIFDLLPGDAAQFEKNAIAKYGPPNDPDAFGWRGRLCGSDCHAPSLLISSMGSSITTVLSDGGLVTKIRFVQRNQEQGLTSATSLTP